MSATRSTLEIAQWTNILAKGFSGPNHKTAKDRLSGKLSSLTLGRGFGETVESYFERKGLTEFYDWAIQKVNN